MAVRELKQFAQRALGLADLEVTRVGNVPRFDLFFRNLRAYGLAPKTVYDVGVNTGTPDLYDAFPSAKFTLFDPSKASLPYMKQLNATRGFDYFNVALGDKDEQAQLSECPSDPGTSSLIHSGTDTRDHVVRVCRFDSLVSSIARPALMKIDAQGYELKILHGLGRLLTEIDFYIIETGTMPPYPEEAAFDRIHDLMRSSGYALHEVVGIIRRPLDGAMTHIDAVYVKTDSALRSDRRWGS
jgi:FkbM family methyltransferase